VKRLALAALAAALLVMSTSPAGAQQVTPAMPKFTADTPPTTAEVGKDYSYTYKANGNPPPTFKVHSGDLPPGLTLDPTTGVLSGKPISVNGGDFSFTVEAANGVGIPDVSPGTAIKVPVPPDPNKPTVGFGSGCNITNLIGCAGNLLSPLNPLSPTSPLNPIGQAGAAVRSGIQAFTMACIGAAVMVLRKVATSLNDNASIDLGAPWFLIHYGVMLSLSVVLLMYGAALATARAVAVGQEGDLLKVFFRTAGAAVMMSAPVLIVVTGGLQLTDMLTQFLFRSSGTGLGEGLLAFADRLQASGANAAGGDILLSLIAILALVGLLLIWISLKAREAVIFISVSFMPMAYAGKPHPSFANYPKRLGHFIAGAVIAKFVLSAILTMAVAWFLHGDTTDFGNDLAFAMILFLTAFAPWKLLSKVGAVFAVGHATGGVRAGSIARRATSPLRHGRVLAFARTGGHGGGSSRGGTAVAGSGRASAGPQRPGGASTSTTWHAPTKPGAPARPASHTATQWGPGGKSTTTHRWNKSGAPAGTSQKTTGNHPWGGSWTVSRRWNAKGQPGPTTVNTSTGQQPGTGRSAPPSHTRRKRHP
jgi:hypothetical protein